MKRSLLSVLFISFCLIHFTGCESVPKANDENISENLLEEKVKICRYNKEEKKLEWEYYELTNSKFPCLREGDKIQISVKLMNDGEFGNNPIYSVLMFFTSGDWENMDFNTISTKPAISNYFNEENRLVLQFDRTRSKYQIEVTLSKDEASKISTKGLIFMGYGVYITSVTLDSSSAKLVYSTKPTLSEQYIENKNIRDNVQDYYKNYTGYKVPYIFISTKDQEEILKKEYYDAIIDVYNCSSEFYLPEEIEEKSAGVKVRGNASAWSETDKPYRIKFNKKQNLLGLHDGKKYKSWVLLKTQWCLGADYLGFKLAQEIYKSSEFDYYASDCTYVHVFVNEKYKGLYLLCEQSQVKKGRIGINENKEKSTDVKTGYLVELDNYAHEDYAGDWENNKQTITSDMYTGGAVWKGLEDYHFELDYKQNGESVILTDVNGNSAQLGYNIVNLDDIEIEYSNDTFTIKSDIYSNEQAAFISNYVAGVWDICYNAIEKGVFLKFDENYQLVDASKDFTNAKQVCEQVIDLESLCNEILLEELIRDFDVGAGSLYMAVDFTVDKGQKYEKLTFESPWDSSWAYSPVSKDPDGGKYWARKKQYFAGAWQNPVINAGEIENKKIYERSHSWFILFNNADWFRAMMREKWNRVGPNNLRSVILKALEDTKVVESEQHSGKMSDYTVFVLDRINYINNYLWK